MIDRLIRLWSWVGAHRLLAGWGIALLGVVAFSSGIVAGAARPQPAAFAERADPLAARLQTTVIEAIVMNRRGDVLVARTRSGALLRIRTDDKTAYRLKNKKADPSVVQRGSRIIVVGRPLGEGLMRARAISVRVQPKQPARPSDLEGPPGANGE